VGGIWLCKPVVGCGEGVAEQLRKLITKLLVEGAGKEEVGDIFSGGIAVGTVGGGAGGLCKVSGRGAVATGGAWGQYQCSSSGGGAARGGSRQWQCHAESQSLQNRMGLESAQV
jgi:hypothetical protein